MNFPSNLRYTKDHEWVLLEGNIATIGITESLPGGMGFVNPNCNNIATIGITEFAQRELGDIVFVDINTVGKTLNAEEVFGTVEAVKTVSDLFLPVTGTVTEINPALDGSPELVNSDPYGKGWMVKMTVSNPADVAALLDAAAYQALVGE